MPMIPVEGKKNRFGDSWWGKWVRSSGFWSRRTTRLIINIYNTNILNWLFIARKPLPLVRIFTQPPLHASLTPSTFQLSPSPSSADVINGSPLMGMLLKVQRSAKRLVRGLVTFVPALAYLFCLPLPGFCLARFTNILADLCIKSKSLSRTTGFRMCSMPSI